MTYLKRNGLSTWGVGREAFEKVYWPTRKVQDPNIPGPGSYNDKYHTIGTEGIQIKFRGNMKMLQDPSEIMIKQNTPGPVYYKLTGNEMAQGNYPLSTVPNPRVGRWSPSKKKFYDEQLRLTALFPGPGQYRIDDRD